MRKVKGPKYRTPTKLVYVGFYRAFVCSTDAEVGWEREGQEAKDTGMSLSRSFYGVPGTAVTSDVLSYRENAILLHGATTKESDLRDPSSKGRMKSKPRDRL